MSDIIDLVYETIVDIPVEKVLDNAKHLMEVVVIGWDGDGEMYIALSNAYTARANFLLDKAKQELLEGE